MSFDEYTGGGGGGVNFVDDETDGSAMLPLMPSTAATDAAPRDVPRATGRDRRQPSVASRLSNPLVIACSLFFIILVGFIVVLGLKISDLNTRFLEFHDDTVDKINALQSKDVALDTKDVALGVTDTAIAANVSQVQALAARNKILGTYNILFGSEEALPPDRYTGQIQFSHGGSVVMNGDRHWKFPFLPFEPTGVFETTSLGEWRQLDDGNYQVIVSRLVLREEPLTDDDPTTSHALTWPIARVLANYLVACNDDDDDDDDDDDNADYIRTLAAATNVYAYKGFPPGELQYNLSDTSQFDDELRVYQEDLDFTGLHSAPGGKTTSGPTIVLTTPFRGKRVRFPDPPLNP